MLVGISFILKIPQSHKQTSLKLLTIEKHQVVYLFVHHKKRRVHFQRL